MNSSLANFTNTVDFNEHHSALSIYYHLNCFWTDVTNLIFLHKILNWSPSWGAQQVRLTFYHEFVTNIDSIHWPFLMYWCLQSKVKVGWPTNVNLAIYRNRQLNYLYVNMLHKLCYYPTRKYQTVCLDIRLIILYIDMHRTCFMINYAWWCIYII